MTRECEYCGFPVNDCACHDEDGTDDLPTCHDCGSELDCNGFCAECDGDPWG
jgi:hypothetical protein